MGNWHNNKTCLNTRGTPWECNPGSDPDPALPILPISAAGQFEYSVPVVLEYRLSATIVAQISEMSD